MNISAKIIFFAAIIIVVIMMASIVIPNVGEPKTPIPNIVDVATIVANIATVMALIFLGLEIRSSTQTSYLQGAMHIYDMLDTPEARKRRRVVYSARERELRQNELEHAEKLRADFNQIGVMVREGLFPKKIALNMHSGTAIRCWGALEQHIKEERKKRDSPSFMENFEWLYEESKKYRKKKYPQETVKWYKRS